MDDFLKKWRTLLKSNRETETEDLALSSANVNKLKFSSEKVDFVKEDW